jgi:hypothetical protein
MCRLRDPFLYLKYSSFIILISFLMISSFLFFLINPLWWWSLLVSKVLVVSLSSLDFHINVSHDINISAKWYHWLQSILCSILLLNIFGFSFSIFSVSYCLILVSLPLFFFIFNISYYLNLASLSLFFFKISLYAYIKKYCIFYILHYILAFSH